MTRYLYFLLSCIVLCFGMQKKSREESSGSGSGVEILVNEPYCDGPGGAGQYTQKIYHIGSHLPGTSLLHEPLPVCVWFTDARNSQYLSLGCDILRPFSQC